MDLFFDVVDPTLLGTQGNLGYLPCGEHMDFNLQIWGLKLMVCERWHPTAHATNPVPKVCKRKAGALWRIGCLTEVIFQVRSWSGKVSYRSL